MILFEKVIRWLLGVLGRPDVEGLAPHLRTVNGELAVVTTSVEGVDSVLFLTVEGDRIEALHAIRNPDKLGAVS